VLESVTEEFTLFSPTGVPLRAKLTVAFREAWTIDEQLQETPRHSTDRTKLRRVQRGETLALIAWREYGDAAEWRAIAETNHLDNPRLLLPGMVLEIPRNVRAGRP
jgi:nucleoid-associated protein YgaU